MKRRRSLALAQCLRWSGLALTTALTSALALAAGSAAAIAQAAGETRPWELQPYEIQLYTVVARDSGLGPEWHEHLREFLANRVRTVVGGCWHLSVAAAPAALGALVVEDIESVTADDLPAEGLAKDKVLLLTMTAQGPRPAIAVREFDVTTRLWNSTVRHPGDGQAALDHAAFELLLCGFAPLGRIEKLDGKSAVVRLRGGSIPRRDRALPLVAPGAAFRPVLVTKDSGGQIVPIAWTWLVPGKIDGPLVDCRIETGLKSPALPEFHPLRARLVLAATPVDAALRLRVVSTGAEATGQPGIDIYRAPSEPPASAAPTNPPPAGTWMGRTDRNGSVSIDTAGPAVEILLLKQGDMPLARLPLVSGLSHDATVSIAVDAAGLSAERFLLATRDLLIDTIGRRELLVGRIRAHIERDQLAQARKLLAELRALVSAESLTAQIANEQRQLWPDGKSADGPLAKQFAELRELAEKHLSKQPIDELAAELAE
jgi:hypothetical protein